jgi:hypothetical protein
MSFPDQPPVIYYDPQVTRQMGRRVVAFQVDRSPFDPDSGFEYYICFKPEVEVHGDEVRSRISIEAAISVSETGDVADLSFELPKICRKEHAISYLPRDPNCMRVENRVYISLPGLNGDAVFNVPATLELDQGGRVVAIESNGCIPKTSTFKPARA